jgi:hypothetical protein
MRRNLFRPLMMQKHDVDVTKRIEFAPAISTKSNQGEWNFDGTVSASSGFSSAENILQQNVNQFSAPATNFAATPARLVLQAQPIVFDLEKLLVKGKNFGWAPRAGRCEPARGVRQNLFEMTGRSHRKFGLLLNLKSETQNPNPVSDAEGAIDL